MILAILLYHSINRIFYNVNDEKVKIIDKEENVLIEYFIM